MHEEKDCHGERQVLQMYNRCLSFYRQQSTIKFWGKAINRSCLVTTWSTLPFIQRKPQIDTAIFYYSRTYHNTQADPAPLWAWPTLRSTEAFHFWKQKPKESHSISYSLQSGDIGWGPVVEKASGHQDVSNSMTPLPGWKHRMTLYYVLVCLVYPSFLSSGISSTKSHKVNCQSYTWTFSNVEIIPTKTLICLHMTTLHVSWFSLTSFQLNI